MKQDRRGRHDKTQQDALCGYLVSLYRKINGKIPLSDCIVRGSVEFFLYRMELHFKVLPTNSMRGTEHIAGSGVHEQTSEHSASLKDNYFFASSSRALRPVVIINS